MKNINVLILELKLIKIFDLKQQLIDYTEYMDKSIKEKEKEIETFKKNYNDLLKDLESIEDK